MIKNSFLFLPRISEKKEAQFRKQGIKVKTIPIKRNISPITDLFLFFRMYFYFRKEKFDNLAPSYKRANLYYLEKAKRSETREKRIKEKRLQDRPIE